LSPASPHVRIWDEQTGDVPAAPCEVGHSVAEGQVPDLCPQPLPLGGAQQGFDLVEASLCEYSLTVVASMMELLYRRLPMTGAALVTGEVVTLHPDQPRVTWRSSTLPPPR
jgi:hypothetical protein